ncbi:MAG: hypothetical protein AVDCRST_MAG77-1415, partial [uncultured Chloroflexi bacterium]
ARSGGGSVRAGVLRESRSRARFGVERARAAGDPHVGGARAGGDTSDADRERRHSLPRQAVRRGRAGSSRARGGRVLRALGAHPISL